MAATLDSKMQEQEKSEDKNKALAILTSAADFSQETAFAHYYPNLFFTDKRKKIATKGLAKSEEIKSLLAMQNKLSKEYVLSRDCIVHLDKEFEKEVANDIFDESFVWQETVPACRADYTNFRKHMKKQVKEKKKQAKKFAKNTDHYADEKELELFAENKAGSLMSNKGLVVSLDKPERLYFAKGQNLYEYLNDLKESKDFLKHKIKVNLRNLDQKEINAKLPLATDFMQEKSVSGLDDKLMFLQLKAACDVSEFGNRPPIKHPKLSKDYNVEIVHKIAKPNTVKYEHNFWPVRGEVIPQEVFPEKYGEPVTYCFCDPETGDKVDVPEEVAHNLVEAFRNYLNMDRKKVQKIITGNAAKEQLLNALDAQFLKNVATSKSLDGLIEIYDDLQDQLIGKKAWEHLEETQEDLTYAYYDVCTSLVELRNLINGNYETDSLKLSKKQQALVNTVRDIIISDKDKVSLKAINKFEKLYTELSADKLQKSDDLKDLDYKINKGINLYKQNRKEFDSNKSLIASERLKFAYDCLCDSLIDVSNLAEAPAHLVEYINKINDEFKHKSIEVNGNSIPIDISSINSKEFKLNQRTIDDFIYFYEKSKYGLQKIPEFADLDKELTKNINKYRLIRNEFDSTKDRLLEKKKDFVEGLKFTLEVYRVPTHQGEKTYFHGTNYRLFLANNDRCVEADVSAYDNILFGIANLERKQDFDTYRQPKHINN